MLDIWFHRYGVVTDSTCELNRDAFGCRRFDTLVAELF